VVDDGSTDENDVGSLHEPNPANLRGVKVVTLATNLGHQRALAVGLSVAVNETDADAVIVMDSDGEDRPLDIKDLLQAAEGQRSFAVVANRKRRTNPLIFKCFYALYKSVFSVMTGRDIRFGNFMLMSRDNAHRLIMHADLWNSLPGALLKSRARITEILIDRGSRYAGVSKMSYTSLVVHGMSQISVFSDIIFVRTLVASGMSFVLGSLVIAMVMGLRFFTNHASPGWASSVIFGILILLLQIITSTLTTMLLLLSSRNQQNIIPMRDYRDYVLSVQEFLPVHASPALGNTVWAPDHQSGTAQRLAPVAV
jgi:glycosyltransferase involved in cell wall biosynthesis